MKQVGLKIENKGRYDYFYSSYRVEERLLELVAELKQENDAIEIKCGREHHYIDYDKDNVWPENYHYDIKRVMYYVREYLGD